MRPLVVLTLLAGLITAAPVPKALKKADDKSSLIGTWKPDKGSEWFQFDTEGGMKAWTTNTAGTPVQYTYAVEPDTDGREWRMIWSMKGQPRPSYQAVFVVDGDRMNMTYSGFSAQPMAKPDPSATPNFTRQTSDK